MNSSDFIDFDDDHNMTEFYNNTVNDCKFNLQSFKIDDDFQFIKSVVYIAERDEKQNQFID